MVRHAACSVPMGSRWANPGPGKIKQRREKGAKKKGFRKASRRGKAELKLLLWRGQALFEVSRCLDWLIPKSKCILCVGPERMELFYKVRLIGRKTKTDWNAVCFVDSLLLCFNHYSSGFLSALGTTCLVAMLSDKELTVGNVGDSRGVLCDKDGNAIPLSYDHKPYQLKERKRIKKAGGPLRKKKKKKACTKPEDEMCNVCVMELCCPLMWMPCIACVQRQVSRSRVQVSPGLLGEIFL